MRHRVRTIRKGIINGIIILIAVTTIIIAGNASAALTAPSWMPGSPILAGDQVVLLWSPVPGAVKYHIYLNGKKVAESVSIQNIIPAPQDGGTYEVEIAPVDASGAEGARSPKGTFSIYKLTSPSELNVRKIGDKVGLNWSATGGAVLYNVYRSEKSGEGFVLVDSVQDVRWTDSKAEKNKKYFYRVTAKDAGGKESPPSVEAVVSTMEVEKTIETAGQNTVVGLKTRSIANIADKGFTAQGIIAIGEPTDIEQSRDGKSFYVASANTEAILIFDRDLGFVGQFGQDPAFPVKRPFGIAVGPDGDVYVADGAKNVVIRYTAKGEFKGVFASIVKEDWMVQGGPVLSDVAVDPRGNVYVLETYNSAVITFNPQGKVLSRFALRKEGSKTGYCNSLKFIEGNLYLQERAGANVIVVNPSGKELFRIGERGSGIGKLVGLGGFSLDVAGKKIYLADAQTYLVQVYDLESRKYLYTLANEENKGQMPIWAPKAIAVDPASNRIYVNEGMVNRISVFEMFGKPEEAK